MDTPSNFLQSRKHQVTLKISTRCGRGWSVIQGDLGLVAIPDIKLLLGHEGNSGSPSMVWVPGLSYSGLTASTFIICAILLVPTLVFFWGGAGLLTEQRVYRLTGLVA